MWRMSDRREFQRFGIKVSFLYVSLFLLFTVCLFSFAVSLILFVVFQKNMILSNIFWSDTSALQGHWSMLLCNVGFTAENRLVMTCSGSTTIRHVIINTRVNLAWAELTPTPEYLLLSNSPE